jgi:hypothetical protein
MIETARPESVGLCSKRLGRVSDWLRAQLDDERLAGASVLIERRGATAFFEGAGFAERETRRPFDADTIVRIYSMTKPVTTVAAMMVRRQPRHLLSPADSRAARHGRHGLHRRAGQLRTLCGAVCAAERWRSQPDRPFPGARRGATWWSQAA